MAWTTPKTWTTGEALTATDMNTYISDNLSALKDPPSDNYEADEVSDYSTSNTSFTDVDATNLALTITTNGGDVMVGFCGAIESGGNPTQVYFDIHESVTAGRLGGDDGIIGFDTSTLMTPVSFVYLVTGLSAASHTFKLQWKRRSNNPTMYAGAGTSDNDYHPQFWVREVS